MKQRITDSVSKEQEAAPFVTRAKILTSWHITTVISVAFIAVLVTAYYADDLGRGNLIAVLTVVFVALIIFFNAISDKHREALLANEFENALFTGAANAGLEFSIITRADNKIAYTSPGCKRYFSPDYHIKEHSFDEILETMGLEEVDKIQLLSAIHTQTHTRRHVQLFDAFGFLQDMIIELHVITRPKGYYMLKAYKEISHSNTDQNNEPEHHSLLLSIIDNLPFGAYLATHKGAILHANEQFVTLLGYTPRNFSLENFHLDDLIKSHAIPHGDISSYWHSMVALKTADGGVTKHSIQQITLGDVKDPSPLLFGFITPPREISDSSTHPADIEKALTDVWRSALEHAPISIAFLSANGMVTHSNKSFARLAAKDSAHGWNILDMMAKEDHVRTKALMKSLHHSVSVEPADPIDINIADKEDTSCLLYISSMGEHTDGYIAHMIETTQQKKFEQRMVQSQKMQAVGQLAGGIAHDFNNLLTAMIGFCDLLLIRHPAGDPSFADIMQVKQNANRAANLVRQLLAFSRKQTLQPEILDITEVLAELSNLIHRLIGEHIELKIIHGRNIDMIKVDKIQFEQVIINLAVNARDAMPSGGHLTIKTNNITIDDDHPVNEELISAAQDDEIIAGNYVLIEVVDSGSGIDPTIINHIFDPFFSTKDTGAGTGLGLATVYGIVKQTGGYIYVTSKHTQGTTFSLFLKTANDKEIEDQQQTIQENEKRELDLTGVGTILLVEDEAPVRMFSARALKNKGYEVLEADNGETALDIVTQQNGDIDLIVTDVMMPGMDGPTMVEKVMKHYPDIKVIFISGYGEDAFIKSYGTERSFNFLPKPYSLKELAGKVKDVLQHTT